MYKFVLPFFLCLMIQNAFAQIPNAGFENWSDSSTPVDWVTTNNPLFTNVSQSSSSHSGSSALRGDVAASIVPPYAFSPTIQSGVRARGFAFSEKPVSVTGYYQYFPAASSGDRFGVNVGLFKGGIDGICVAIAAIANPTITTAYTQFTADFVYQTEDIPDTCIAQFMIVGPGTGVESYPHVGSYYLLDDLAFSGSTAVEKPNTVSPETFSLSQNYPNPFNPSTTISYSLSKASFVKLRVFNILGKEVTTLVNGFRSAGKHTAHFLASNIASGVYFYRLEAEGYTAMKHMLLLK